MKILKSSFLIAFAVGLFGCGDNVPKVNPHNIVVDGIKLKQAEFLQKYCTGKIDHEMCLKVANALAQDATKGGTVSRF